MPAAARRTTPVRLLATAGLRLLAPAAAAAILEACRAKLAESEFHFAGPEWTSVISGDMEGLYGWAAVNYLTGALQVGKAGRPGRAGSLGDGRQAAAGTRRVGRACERGAHMPRGAAPGGLMPRPHLTACRCRRQCGMCVCVCVCVCVRCRRPPGTTTPAEKRCFRWSHQRSSAASWRWEGRACRCGRACAHAGRVAAGSSCWPAAAWRGMTRVGARRHGLQ